MQARPLVSTNNLSRPDWLLQRRRGIGGSDAPSILGLNEYCSPYALWARKTGRIEESEENERMRVGIALEPYVADRFCDLTGKRVRRRNAILQHPEHEFMLANIDREVIGERAGLECKTTSAMNLRQFKGGEYPARFYVQCMHYLAVTGYDRWYLAVLVLGSAEPPIIFTIERDEAEIDALIGAEREFWDKHILADVPPPMDGAQSTSEALFDAYKGGDKQSIQIHRANEAARICDIKAQIKALKAEEERCAQIIKDEMKDAESATCGSYEIIWSSQTRRTFDVKRYVQANPHLDLSQFYNETPCRSFSIKEAKPDG